jgi:Cof subfamily protein (haloacid dehalogenase superfamily)
MALHDSIPIPDVKLVACDLDGTLLRSDGTLDTRSERALIEVQRSGLQLVICTARPPRWLGVLASATGGRGTAICANGAVIWDLQAAAALDVSPVAPPAAREVVRRLAASFPAAHWAAEWSDGFGREPGYRTQWPLPDGTVIAPIRTLIERPAVKLLLRQRGTGVDAALARARAVVGPLAEVTHSSSGDVLLEISAPGVSKAATLARLCGRRGVRAEQVIAFGDMPNDLAMLGWAGHAVAVANAHPDVLAAADEVTAGNDEAGVAQVLERLLASSRAGR